MYEYEPVSLIIWIGFIISIVVMIILDFWGLQHFFDVTKIKDALIVSALWIGAGLAFNVLVYFWQGVTSALAYLTAFLVEKSLSVDNLFVFLVIFSYFAVPFKYQRTVLLLGILGAMVFRGIFIAAGVTLLKMFHWLVYILGAILIMTGIRLLRKTGEEVDPGKNPVVRLARRFLPITDHYEGAKFFLRKNGQFLGTPLLLVLIAIETTDIVFAVDSVPACLAITWDPFIVWSSNVFAILGLRALFFALAGVMRTFHYLHYGLAFILVFIGIKMILAHFYKIPVGIALSVVGATLFIAIMASVIWPPKAEPVPE